MPDKSIVDPYSHGHHESVLRGHAWRSAANSASYLLPELTAGQSLLDVGCGPGTITADLARAVAPGRVRGVDVAETVINTAIENTADLGLDNLTFAVDNVYGLAADDATYDVVHAHQVLQHLGDPVAALGELRRVLVPGGLLAVRDADYGSFVWAPDNPLLDRWLELYHDVANRNGGQPDAGRWLPSWVHAAGFVDVRVSASAWVFTTPDEREWWGGQWADRVTESNFATQALDYDLASTAELAELAGAFRSWAVTPDASFVLTNVEVLARVPHG